MDDRPKAIADLEFQNAGEEVLVHDGTRRKIHVLNESAARILLACDGSRDVGMLARTLTDEVDERVYDEVASLIATFRELGLVA